MARSTKTGDAQKTGIAMNAAGELSALRSARGVALFQVAFHRYATIGLSAVDLVFQSGNVVQLVAREIPGSPFEAFSIGAVERATGSSDTENLFTINDALERAEGFMRDEWAERVNPGYDTIGNNPVEINTGRLGTAPRGAPSVQSICGVGLTFCGGGVLLTALSDYAGLLEVFTGVDAIDHYRSTFSTIVL